MIVVMVFVRIKAFSQRQTQKLSFDFLAYFFVKISHFVRNLGLALLYVTRFIAFEMIVDVVVLVYHCTNTKKIMS